MIFLGKQDSVAELLTCADLLLLPSQNESFGLVALEHYGNGGGHPGAAAPDLRPLAGRAALPAPWPPPW